MTECVLKIFRSLFNCRKCTRCYVCMLLFTYGDSQGLHITYPALVQSVSVAITCARDNPDSAAHTTDVHNLGAVGYTVTAKRCAEIERTVGPSKRCSSRAPDLVFSSLARVPRRTRDAARVTRLRRVLACKVVNQRQRVSGMACREKRTGVL